MAANKEHDEPAALAARCFQNGDYKLAGQQLDVVETAVGSNKRLQHNKALVKFMQTNMKDVNNFVSSLSSVLGVEFPEIEEMDLSNAFHVYNYAVVLYHSTYYTKCTCLLDKLIPLFSSIRNKRLQQYIVMLYLETSLCCNRVERTLDVARKYGDVIAGNNELITLFDRVISRAHLKKKSKVKTSLKPDNIENLFIIAYDQFINNDKSGAMYTLMQYKRIKLNYNSKNQGEDIWPAMNNNLGVIYLSINKFFLGKIHFQDALKQYLRSVSSEDAVRLITCRDRPLYVYNLGLALLGADIPESAFECFTEAVRHYPNNARLWVRLAECCVKKCCKNEGTRYIQKLLGKGLHTRYVIMKEKLNKDTMANDFSIPTLSLEFALKCLEKAKILLSKREPPADVNIPVIELSPAPPISWKQRCYLMNSIAILQSYILLYLREFDTTLRIITELLNQPDLASSHRALAHIYAAEALNNINRQTDARQHLNPQVMHELTRNFPSKFKESFEIALLGKMADVHIRNGDIETARKILLPVHSLDLLPLQIYVVMLSGDIRSCRTFLRSRMRLTYAS